MPRARKAPSAQASKKLVTEVLKSHSEDPSQEGSEAFRKKVIAEVKAAREAQSG
jgi:hypothetical protein